MNKPTDASGIMYVGHETYGGNFGRAKRHGVQYHTSSVHEAKQFEFKNFWPGHQPNPKVGSTIAGKQDARVDIVESTESGKAQNRILRLKVTEKPAGKWLYIIQT